jgi:hypothetical protein
MLGHRTIGVQLDQLMSTKSVAARRAPDVPKLGYLNPALVGVRAPVAARKYSQDLRLTRPQGS